MKDWISKALGISVILLALLVWMYTRFSVAFFPMYGKGGVGAANYDSYVITSGNVNAAICGEERWTGRPKSETETVSCMNSRVTKFQVSDLFNSMLVFHFTPQRIRVFDLKRLEGGYYLRETEEEGKLHSE